MKSRLFKTIARAKKEKRKLFCAFLTLGYPSLESTEKLIEGFAKRGVDIIELGFPFSDPLADGPVIQYSSECALKRGVQMEDALQMVRNLRKKGIQVPLLLFSYLNPLHFFGLKRLPDSLKKAGFDGLIVPDCPGEEEPDFWKACRKKGLAPVFLVAPTTSPERARKIFARTQGFLYYVSLRGVTGARAELSPDWAANVKRLARMSPKPVLIGFGVSTPEQVRTLSRSGNGVIVGSAIVNALRESGGRLEPVFSFVESLLRALPENHGRHHRV